jgi:hypothetical protein
MSSYPLKLLTSALLLVCFTGAARVVQSQELSASLTQQLLGNQYTDKTWAKREQQIKLAMTALKQQGVINAKPIVRYDYEDIYRVNKPVVILGLKPVLLIHEYMTQYSGCCVNDGIAIVLEDSADSKAIRAFAKTNWCGLYDYNEASYFESQAKFRKKSQAYLLLSCRANEASEFEPSKK